jgi:EAL domain-containing protein (putative c-di-GMP-specific phosphodiesterase class I)
MLKNLEVIPFLHPFIDVKTDKIAGYEVLMRLKQKRENNILTPNIIFSRYISHYETIIIRMHNILFKEIFPSFENSNYFFSINISLHFDWENKLIKENFIKLISENKKYVSNLIIEILEDYCGGINYLNDDKELKYIEEINSLKRKYHFKIAIDDFGNGYSNFKRYFLFDTDIIKIDGFLINNYSEKKIRKILKEIKRIFKPNKIVFEHIDDEDKKNLLKGYCDYMQGFFFGEPKYFKNILDSV